MVGLPRVAGAQTAPPPNTECSSDAVIAKLTVVEDRAAANMLAEALRHFNGERCLLDAGDPASGADVPATRAAVSEASRVFVVGGPAAIPDAWLLGTLGVSESIRIAGATRWDTQAAVARAIIALELDEPVATYGNEQASSPTLPPNDDCSGAAVVANLSVVEDRAAANMLAEALDAIHPDRLGRCLLDAGDPKAKRPPTSADAIASATASRHYVVGGPAALSDVWLATSMGVFDPIRVAGHDRWDTQARVAAWIITLAQSQSEQSSDSAPGGAGDTSSQASTGFLAFAAVNSESDCASRAQILSPGDSVRLLAVGFAAGSSVEFEGVGVSLLSPEGVLLDAPRLPPATADPAGQIDVLWVIPDAPSSSEDAAPRIFAFRAMGPNDGGGVHTALMLSPIVTSPGVALCALDDTASTDFGTAVEIPVLANDIAPTGGSLLRHSVEVGRAAGGEFTVDEDTGIVTFRPDTGFSGTVSTHYLVEDSWGLRTRGDVTIEVTLQCTITGVKDEVNIVGTDGDDVLCVPDRDDRWSFHIMDGRAGDDLIVGGAGVEWIYGGDGNDTIHAGGSDDTIVAGSGIDVVYGGTGFDTVHSLDLADTIHDEPGGWELNVAPTITVQFSGPEPVDDWVWVGASQTASIDVLANDHDPNENLDPRRLTITRQPTVGTARVVEVSYGHSVVEYVASASGGHASFAYQVCDTLRQCATAQVTVVAGTTGCTIMGTAGNDTLRGTPGNDVVCGLGGDDVIHGLGGNDIIIGGTGNDTLYGGDATPIDGSDGEDVLWGGVGNDTLHGGTGNDRLFGAAGGDILYGNEGDDQLDGGAGDDTLDGGIGIDTMWGGSGNDDLDGGSGMDTMRGGFGDDTLEGGPGDDSLWGNSGNDTLRGDVGADRMHGGSGNDHLDGGPQDDALWGGPGDDALFGENDHDQLSGGTGHDMLHGGPGDDRLYGGWGDDQLHGDSGDDYLQGGLDEDNDQLDGGSDADTCSGGDIVTGCETETGRR